MFHMRMRSLLHGLESIERTPWQIMVPDQSVVVDRGVGRFSRRSRARKPTASDMDSSRVRDVTRSLLAALPLLPCRALQSVSTMVAPAGLDGRLAAGCVGRWGALGAPHRRRFGIGVSIDGFNLGEQGGVDGRVPDRGNDSARLTPVGRSCLAGCAAAVGPRGGEARSSSWSTGPPPPAPRHMTSCTGVEDSRLIRLRSDPFDFSFLSALVLGGAAAARSTSSTTGPAQSLIRSVPSLSVATAESHLVTTMTPGRRPTLAAIEPAASERTRGWPASPAYALSSVRPTRLSSVGLCSVTVVVAMWSAVCASTGLARDELTYCVGAARRRGTVRRRCVPLEGDVQEAGWFHCARRGWQAGAHGLPTYGCRPEAPDWLPNKRS